jgi:formylmethanofuran dehydrogenase subunit B
VAGADSVLAWQTGYPFSVNFGPGHPRYNPGEFTAQDVLIRGEADVCLLVGSGGVRRFSAEGVAALERTPTIALDGPQDESLGKPLVRFTTAVPGVHVAGTAYRMDEVPIRLRPILPKEYPSDAEILDGILARL